ncbi:MAG: glycosyltransferase family 9 protein [Candidatus Paceibacterota bacterium]|jgi:ADP-heptose:LPS heptosyltransferase
MNGRKANWDYLNLYQEIPLFCALVVSSFFTKSRAKKTGSVLIVNTCLIGEFAASIPAMREYIQRHEGGAVDLMVSPPLKPLAEKICGVRRVYVAKSLYRRSSEEAEHTEQVFDAYDTVFVMRISKDAFRLIRTIAANNIRTGLREYSGYALHLWGSLLNRKPPKQWIELNFEMLGGKLQKSSYGEPLHFTESELADVQHLEAFQTAQKKVIIHTGASWIMKKWDIEKWTALLNKLQSLDDFRFIFVGGEEDAGDYNLIASKLGFPVYSLIGKINLPQLLLALRESDYFIGVDSGPANMAHLADTRSLTILGPGPHFYLPWSSKDVIIDKSRGRGLYQMFFAKKNGFIDQITVEEVYAGFVELLRRSATYLCQ